MIVEFTIESPMRMGLVKCLQRVDTVHKTAPWMKNITLKNAFVEGGMPLHKGAAKYYREIGLEIPDSIKPVD